MKKVIKLTESDLHNIVTKSVNRILKENRLDVKTLYHDLIDKLDTFIDALYDEGHAGEGCDKGNKLVEDLKSAKNSVKDYFRHPDVGGNTTVWDNVGF